MEGLVLWGESFLRDFWTEVLTKFDFDDTLIKYMTEYRQKDRMKI